MYSTILMIRICRKIVHNYSWASHASWSTQYRPMLQTQNYPLGHHCTLLCFPTSTAQFVYISTVILGHTWVYNIAWARTRRWQDCSWPVVMTAVTYHIVLSTVQFVMTNVRLAWDKTRCHAFIVYHRTYFIVYHLHTCQWRNFQPERYDQCDKYII